MVRLVLVVGAAVEIAKPITARGSVGLNEDPSAMDMQFWQRKVYTKWVELTYVPAEISFMLQSPVATAGLP